MNKPLQVRAHSRRAPSRPKPWIEKQRELIDKVWAHRNREVLAAQDAAICQIVDDAVSAARRSPPQRGGV